MKKTLALMLALLLALGAMTTLAAAEGKLIYPIDGDPQQMDPSLNSYKRSSSVLKQLFVGLYKVGPDGSTMLPGLAESYTVSDDGKHYTFTLRADLKWSDGSPLTAADIEYSWKRVLNPELASKAVSDMLILVNGKEYNEGKATADDVGVKAVDDRTLQVDLVNPTPWFISLTSTTAFMPVKKDVVEGATPWVENAATYISCGPFMLKEYRLKDRLELVKNPNYFDAANVSLDAVDIVIIEDAAGELVAYENGEIDIADNLNAEAIAKFRDTPEYGLIHTIGERYLDFNCEKPPFDNKLVRQAFCMTIDRNIIIENVLQTQDQVAMGWVPIRQRSVTDPSKTYREVAGDMYGYDVEKAKALLVEAGYTDMSTFPEVELVGDSSQANKDLCQAFQAMWEANLGVKVKITTYESSAFWTELDNGNFNIDINGFTGDFEDPLANLKIYRTGSNAYENRWDNAEFDAKIDAIFAEVDPAKREAMMIDAEKMLADEMPTMPIHGRSDDFLCKPYVHGLAKNALGHVLLEYVTMDAK